jgi:hypothetical protein
MNRDLLRIADRSLDKWRCCWFSFLILMESLKLVVDARRVRTSWKFNLTVNSGERSPDVEFWTTTPSHRIRLNGHQEVDQFATLTIVRDIMVRFRSLDTMPEPQFL